MKQLLSRIDTNMRAPDNICAKAESLSEPEKRYTRVKVLHDTVGGKRANIVV